MSGAENAIIDGVVDTSGSHPKVDLCRQAMIDAAQASLDLGGLPVNEDLGRVTLNPGEDMTLFFGGTGVHVKSAVLVRLKKKGGSYAPDITFTFGLFRPLAVLNVERSVSAGKLGRIRTNPELPNAVLNLPEGGSVNGKANSGFQVVTLTPQGRIKIKADVHTCQLYGRDVRLKGTDVLHDCLPPGSSSGAFLDSARGVLD